VYLLVNSRSNNDVVERDECEMRETRERGAMIGGVVFVGSARKPSVGAATAKVKVSNIPFSTAKYVCTCHICCGPAQPTTHKSRLCQCTAPISTRSGTLGSNKRASQHTQRYVYDVMMLSLRYFRLYDCLFFGF
jgi:hypothetical protein